MNTDEEKIGRYEEEMMEIDLRELITLFWRKKWFIIILVFLAMVAAYLLSNQMTRIYETSTMIMVREEGGADSLFSNQFSLIGGQGNKVATYTAMMKSRLILNKVIEELELVDEEGELIKTKSLREKISISSTADTDLMTITVQYSDPVLARDIANKLVEVFKEENQRINNSDLNSAITFISKQLAQVQEELAELEEELLKYKEENGIILPTEYGAGLLRRLTELETRRIEAELALEEARIALVESKKHFNQEEREILSSKTIASNPLISSNRQRLVELEVELAGLLEVYTEKHPQVLEIKEKINKVEKVLATNVEEIISSRTETLNPIYQGLKEKIIQLETAVISSEARIAGLTERIREQEKELGSLPAKELNLIRLERETKVAENIYLILMERREEVQIQEAMQNSDIVVIDPAIVSAVPVKPRTVFNMAIAAILAGMLAVFIIFLQNYFDNTVKEEKDIERLTGLTVLGVIPDMEKIDHNQGYGVDNNV